MLELKACETFSTIQGEGKYIGYPSFFIRTTGCNLRCAWKDDEGITLCDTPYTSFEPEVGKPYTAQNTESFLLRNLGVRHIVISGGEPCIQRKALVHYLNEAQALFMDSRVDVITIETNGTIFLPDIPLRNIFFSFSPKLSSSYEAEGGKEREMHKNNNFFIDSIAKYILKGFDYQLKFVVTTPEDFLEIKDVLRRLEHEIDAEIPHDHVWIMPQGIKSEQLKAKETSLVQECIERGYNFSPRLHINIWGNKRGT